jgi:hypothetical protein
MVAYGALNADEMKILNDMLTVKINERLKKEKEADKGKKKASSKKTFGKEAKSGGGDDDWGSFSRGASSGGATAAANTNSDAFAMDDDYDFM